MPGSLVLVGTPIGNLEDITLRALRALKEADLIAAEDTRRTARLLSHYGITTPTTSLHDHNERSRLPGLLARVEQGLRLAVVSDAGMPTISDPGFLAVRMAIDQGLTVEVIPGVSALTTAVAGSGLPPDRLTFLGFAPARSGERERWLGRLGSAEGTIVFFEAPGRLLPLLHQVLDILGDRFVVIAHELTKMHESWHRGWVSELLSGTAPALPDKGEFVVLLSDQIRGGRVAAAPTDAEVMAMFVERSGTGGRREAVAAVAKHFDLSQRQVYALVEKHKNSVE